jgi:hypothetical protein
MVAMFRTLPLKKRDFKRVLEKYPKIVILSYFYLVGKYWRADILVHSPKTKFFVKNLID